MKNEKIKILVVDDEPDILEILTVNLENEGYDIFTAKNGKKALKIADTVLPGIIILDLMMPILDGIETCQRLRLDKRFKDSVIIFLTARGEDYSHIAAYEAGADDYITKPVKPKVLVSKIKAILRRSSILKDKVEVLEFEDLMIYPEEYKIQILGKFKILPRKEFELLYLLASKPEKIFRRDQIMDLVWGDHVVVGDRTIDVHVRKLREKLVNRFIGTQKGVGYKFFK